MDEEKIVPVILKAEGKFCADYCGDCVYLDTSRDNGKGEYYCPFMAEGSFWSYVSPTEKACRHFRSS